MKAGHRWSHACGNRWSHIPGHRWSHIPGKKKKERLKPKNSSKMTDQLRNINTHSPLEAKSILNKLHKDSAHATGRKSAASHAVTLT